MRRHIRGLKPGVPSMPNTSAQPNPRAGLSQPE
jgi:hypothetical protein